jgi:hypothetical protein
VIDSAESNRRSPVQPSLYDVYSSGGLLTGIYSGEQKDWAIKLRDGDSSVKLSEIGI